MCNFEMHLTYLFKNNRITARRKQTNEGAKILEKHEVVKSPALIASGALDARKKSLACAVGVVNHPARIRIIEIWSDFSPAKSFLSVFYRLKGMLPFRGSVGGWVEAGVILPG